MPARKTRVRDKVSIETAQLAGVADEDVVIRLRIPGKIMSETRKTMSDVGKIISDIVFSTSDLFLPLARCRKTSCYIGCLFVGISFGNQCLTHFMAIMAVSRLHVASHKNPLPRQSSRKGILYCLCRKGRGVCGSEPALFGVSCACAFIVALGCVEVVGEREAEVARMVVAVFRNLDSVSVVRPPFLCPFQNVVCLDV